MCSLYTQEKAYGLEVFDWNLAEFLNKSLHPFGGARKSLSNATLHYSYQAYMTYEKPKYRQNHRKAPPKDLAGLDDKHWGQSNCHRTHAKEAARKHKSTEDCLAVDVRGDPSQWPMRC